MWKMADSTLEAHERWRLVEYTLSSYPDMIGVEHLDKLPLHKKVFDQVSKYYDLSTCRFVEQWHNAAHNSFYPLEHLDKDEGLWEAEQKVSLPLCSAVLYLSIKRLKGANLEISKDNHPLTAISPEFKDIDIITPEEGKMALLDPGVWHRVSDYESGFRVAMILNFWDKPLYNP